MRFAYAIEVFSEEQAQGACVLGTFTTPSDFASFRLSKRHPLDLDFRKLPNQWIRTYSERPLTGDEEDCLRRIAEEGMLHDKDELAVEPPGILTRKEVPKEWISRKVLISRSELVLSFAGPKILRSAKFFQDIEAHIERSLELCKEFQPSPSHTFPVE